ncbi:hypothetical protein BH11PLA1_BH11PLA1_18180 [soil metagenome]
MAVNERKTEDMVEAQLRKRGYYKSGSGIIVEKQKSDNHKLQKLLEHASKKGGGVGKPEFLIRSDSHSEFVIVVECKASTQKHESPSLTKYSEFAVDGALLYASFLSKEYDVLAISVSGEAWGSRRISHHLHLRGASKAAAFPVAQEILSLDDYYEALLKSDAKFRQDYEALLDYSRSLNDLLQAKKMLEARRGFLISAVLIGLQNDAFKKSFKSQRRGKDIAVSLLATIEAEFSAANLPAGRQASILQAFSFIEESPVLVGDKDFFIELIEGIEENVNAFMRTHKYYDTIGQFYVEFLRYANNDKGLGIVLTPPHVAELFADLAEVDHQSVVYDNCCGTAGLLIAAMKRMILATGGDRKKEARVKNKQLVGIEFQPEIFALAVSNMILHGDGKTNISRGDCFSDGPKTTEPYAPSVGVLNPPYKNKRMPDDREELEYVFNNLECLSHSGKCVAIVPITCATVPTGTGAEWKRKLLEKHTLEAVMSMPVELFHNSKTLVVTCVMVFTAGRPHPKGKKTWFGYWRDDGFVKTKHRGRIDASGTWPQRKTHWLNAFRNREELDGFSVTREVSAVDEWCAEAYLAPNYRQVTEQSVSEAAKRYLLKSAMMMHQSGSGGEDEQEA